MLEITRISTDPEVGTFGVAKWTHERSPFALACENPWLDNAPFVSCIPSGLYACRPVVSPSRGSTYEICDVPGRTHVLFHKGNTHLNTEGCILLGESFDFLNGIPSVKSSKVAFDEFMKEALSLGDFSVNIQWVVEP